MIAMRGAFVLHLHYEPLALDLVRRVTAIDNGFEVWVTGQAAGLPSVRRVLDGLRRPVTVIDAPNAGRDIGALCFILPSLADRGFEVIAKLHTKGGGSGYGREWRDHMLDRLATPDAAGAVQAALAADPGLGMVGPDRLLKPVSGHMFRNRARLAALVASLAQGRATPQDWSFFAGSMWWARMAALEPLTRIAGSLTFEPEGGAHDGRLEHAIERALGVTPSLAGRAVATVSRTAEGKARVTPPAADAEPLIKTLATLRQARIAALTTRRTTPAEIALAWRCNPLVHYLDGGLHDPNRSTHEAWRRDRRPEVAPSLIDWPAGPPASPLSAGRAAALAPTPRLIRRLERARAEGRAPSLRVGVVAPAGKARGARMVEALGRLGHVATAGPDCDPGADLCLVLGGGRGFVPPEGPTRLFVPLERAARAAYAEYDRHDVALVDQGLAGLWDAIVRARVGVVPREGGEAAQDVDRWVAAVIEAAAARLEDRRGPEVVVMARTGAGGWPRSSAYIRLFAPLSAAGRRPGFAPTGAAIAPGAEVIVQRDAVADVEAAEALIARVRAAGGRLVFDIDDALHRIGPEHPDHADFAPRLAAMDRIARAAGEIRCATRALADHYRALGPPVVVEENRLDRRLWREALARPVAPPRRDGPLQLLYMGTATHDEDLAPVIAAIDALEAARPGGFALTLIGGMAAAPARPWLRVLTPPAGQRAYPRFVRWLGRQTAADGGPFELGLAPLADTAFNAGKSDLKLLDYAALGLASLASDVGPYAVSTLPRRRAAAGWAEALARAQGERGRLADEAGAARRILEAERTIGR